MKKTIVGAAAAACFLLATTSARAQEGFELELRAGAAFPTEEIQGESLDNGLGGEATLAYWFIPELAVYGGWGWHRFGSDQSFAGPEADTEETGYTYGLRFQYPFVIGRSMSPRLRLHAGATYEHLEVENADGDQIGDSDHGVGWEAGAGVAFPVSEAWKVTPVVRYRSLSRDVTVGDVVTEVDLRYIAAEIGVSWSFGS